MPGLGSGHVVPRRGAAGPRFGVGGDDAEELLERAATGLHGAGENLALGGPVAVGDGERGELVPEEEEATERREQARVQATGLHRGDTVLPDQASRDRVTVQEETIGRSVRAAIAPEARWIATIVSRSSEPSASRARASARRSSSELAQ